MKKNKKPYGVIFTSILISFCLYIMILGTKAAKQNKLFSVFGYSYSVVITDSMEDEIMVNDLIFINTKIKFSEIVVDDIIVYYNHQENKNIVHRVIKVNDDNTLTTKGDNNIREDSLKVTEEMYFGKVIYHSKFLGVGGLISGNNRSAILVVMILIFLYLTICFGINIVLILREKEYLNKKDQLDKELQERKEQLRLEVMKELEEEKKASS